MITIPSILLFAQAVLTLQPIGYITGPNRRLYPLYGMQGNFVLGDPENEDVISAATFADDTLQKRTAEIRWSGGQSGHAAPGPAIFAWDAASRKAYAWLPESRQLIASIGGSIPMPEAIGDVLAITFASPGRLRLLHRKEGLELSDIDLKTSGAVSTQLIHAGDGTLDSHGNLWLAADTAVTCGNQQWKLDEPLLSFLPMADGWVLLKTEHALQAARCTTPDLFQVPSP